MSFAISQVIVGSPLSLTKSLPSPLSKLAGAITFFIRRWYSSLLPAMYACTIALPLFVLLLGVCVSSLSLVLFSFCPCSPLTLYLGGFVGCLGWFGRFGRRLARRGLGVRRLGGLGLLLGMMLLWLR